MQTIETEQSSIHPIIHEVLKKRGFDTPEQINEFLSWNLHNLPALTGLNDIEKSADRIIQALENKEQIGIYGDYDVDGTTSCALLFQYFKMLKVEVKLYQPSRFVEGYGIHPVSIDNAIEDGVKVLITVDCGISNNETADYALAKNIDLIITDHHKDAKPEMPKAYAIVNPNRRDEDLNSELTTLAGVGVAFALCLSIKNKLDAKGQNTPSIYPLLQYVAIGTICDLAKLTPMNLKMVRHGLKQIVNTQYAGVECFFNDEDRQAPFIPSEKISFYVGPLINSKGRLDHPEKALKLLIAPDHRTAFENYSHLEISNKERKFIQNEVFSEAKDMVIKQMSDADPVISIVYAPHFHEGVIGIVASKLVETFQVPAIVFSDAEDEGVIKASARSAGNLNLFDALKSCEDLFLKFGGHKAAAGLSMPKENFETFKKRIKSYLNEIPAIERTVQEYYDAEVSFNQIDPVLVKGLELLEPFGMGNERPTFIMRDAKLESYQLLKDIHVKWFFTSKDNPKHKIQGISFNYIGKWGCLHPEELFARQEREGLKVKFQLGVNRFRGNEIIQLIVDRISLES